VEVGREKAFGMLPAHPKAKRGGLEVIEGEVYSNVGSFSVEFQGRRLQLAGQTKY